MEGGKTEGIATSKGGGDGRPKSRDSDGTAGPSATFTLLPFQNWEPACKRGAQEGTPLDPCGLAPFSLSRLGPDVNLLQEGAFLHSSNLKIKLHPFEVVVIETNTTQTTSPQFTHAPRYPAPTRRWSPDGHFSGRGWGNNLVALECNPQRQPVMVQFMHATGRHRPSSSVALMTRFGAQRCWTVVF